MKQIVMDNARVSEFQAIIERYIPHILMPPYLYSNKTDIDDEELNHMHFVIPPDNHCLQGSSYFYEKKSLAHFTSVSALYSILQDKSVRFYNLHNLNDPREYTFLANLLLKNLPNNEKVIADAKDNLYVMSFCETDIFKKKQIPNEFNLWRLYGHDGKGVALVFSILNEPRNWYNFHVSKILYGTKNRSAYSEFKKQMDRFNKSKPTASVDFGKLFPFHKSNLFKHEMEVRIVFDARTERSGWQNLTVSQQEEHVFPIIKPDIFKLFDNRDYIKYLRLPLYTANNTGGYIDSKMPKLKLDKIVIGYEFLSGLKAIVDNLAEICKDCLGYIPKIEQTALHKFYRL